MLDMYYTQGGFFSGGRVTPSNANTFGLILCGTRCWGVGSLFQQCQQKALKRSKNRQKRSKNADDFGADSNILLQNLLQSLSEYNALDNKKLVRGNSGQNIGKCWI